MGGILSILNIFGFVRNFRKEKKKYASYGVFRKILNFIFDIVIVAFALGLCYLAFYLFEKTASSGFNNLYTWSGAIAVTSLALYFVPFSFENCIISSIIAFLAALSLTSQSDQAVKNVFETKEQRAHDTQGLDLLLGFLNLILAMGLLAGIIIVAVFVF